MFFPRYPYWKTEAHWMARPLVLEWLVSLKTKSTNVGEGSWFQCRYRAVLSPAMKGTILLGFVPCTKPQVLPRFPAAEQSLGHNQDRWAPTVKWESDLICSALWDAEIQTLSLGHSGALQQQTRDTTRDCMMCTAQAAARLQKPLCQQRKLPTWAPVVPLRFSRLRENWVMKWWESHLNEPILWVLVLGALLDSFWEF